MSRLEGGLQIRDLKFQNLAMGAKLLWNLVDRKPSWSSKVIWKKYFVGPRLRCLDTIPRIRHALPSLPSSRRRCLGLKKICIGYQVMVVTKINSYGLGYHNRQLNSRNQSFPICKRNKTTNTKGS